MATKTSKKTKPLKPPAAPPPATEKPASHDGSLKHVLLGWYGIIGLTLSYILPFRLPFVEVYAKDYWRHALGSLLVVLGLVAGTLGLALYLFDANDFKSQIVDYVKLNKQRDMVLEGDIHLTYFPKLGLETGKLSVSQRNSTRKFASVDNARLYISWLPLLRKQVQVERIVLDGLHANLLRNKDGSTNFDDLLVTADWLGDVKFEVEKIRILESSLNFQDQASSRTLFMHDLNLETGRLADGSSGLVETRFRLQSAQPQLDLQTSLQGHVQYDRASQRFEVSNIEGQMQGEAVGISGLTLELHGSLAAQPALHQVVLDKVTATAAGQLEQRQLQASLSLNRLQLDKQVWQGSAMTLDASLTLDQDKRRASMEVPTFKADAKTLSSAGVKTTFELTRAGASLQGQLSSPLSLDLETRELQLDAITGSWSASHPLLAAKLNASASGKLLARLPAQQARLEFKTTVDDSEFTGNVSLQDFKSPAYVFDVAVNTLDVDRYLVTDWTHRLLSDTQTLDFSAIDALNLRGRLRVDALRAARLKATEFSADLQSGTSTLGIDAIQARLYGGSLQGALSLSNGDAPQVAARQKLTGVQVDALLADLLPGEARLGGKGNLAFELQAQGHSIGALRQTLTGTASLGLTRGALAGINLAEALVAGKEQIGIKDAEHSDNVRLTESTAFAELKASFDITQGLASSSDFVLKSPLLSCRGEGEITLETGQLDARLSTTVAPGLRRNAGPLAELSGISVPLHISGPWSTASVRYMLDEASGANVTRLSRANLARVAASASDKSTRATK